MLRSVVSVIPAVCAILFCVRWTLLCIHAICIAVATSGPLSVSNGCVSVDVIDFHL